MRQRARVPIKADMLEMLPEAVTIVAITLFG